MVSRCSREVFNGDKAELRLLRVERQMQLTNCRDELQTLPFRTYFFPFFRNSLNNRREPSWQSQIQRHPTACLIRPTRKLSSPDLPLSSKRTTGFFPVAIPAMSSTTDPGASILLLDPQAESSLLLKRSSQGGEMHFTRRIETAASRITLTLFYLRIPLGWPCATAVSFKCVALGYARSTTVQSELKFRRNETIRFCRG